MTPPPPTSSLPHSLWLQEIAGDQPDAPPLSGAITADVAIVGAGYVGLWTALRIKELEPACDVVVLEQGRAGYGASGRNGGFVLAWWPKLASLTRLIGPDEAVRLCQASEDAIAEIRDFCDTHNIDADFRQGGWLWTATSRAQFGAWDALLRLCARKGITPYQPLSPAEVAARSGSAAHLAGVMETKAAIVQPAALARGLRRVALERGVRLFEHTRIRRFTRGRPVTLVSDAGSVRTDRLVIATNGWAASLPELGTSLAVISSDLVATAPVPEILGRLGWERDLGITDSQTMVDYYRVSRDGRVVFGKGGWTIALGGRIGAAFDHSPERTAEVTADLHRYYPALASVPVTHAWSGPIDRAPMGFPLFGRLGGREHIVYGVGWSGNGVGPSVLGGKILASLALGRRDEWGTTPLIDRSQGHFPPEPIRYLGAHLVRAAVVRKERAENRDERPSWLATRIAALAPAGLEDKK